MVEHVYRRACEARSVRRVLVATDDLRVFETVRAFGGEVVMTSPHHRTGSERVAEVAAGVNEEMIDAAVAACAAAPQVVMSTVRRAITDPHDLDNPAVVKVVTDLTGRALYFTRTRVPFVRDAGTAVSCYKHIGLYVYRREFLLHLTGLAPTPLERTESLEQLRALEHGFSIMTVETTADAIGVDTPDDLERIRRLVAASTLR
jgi:3-deoxy-manno-octulosonate cytidylyltransferase (CMP-KDO synthetase)